MSTTGGARWARILLAIAASWGCSTTSSRQDIGPPPPVGASWAFADTATTDEGYTIRLFNHDSLWPGAIDSVAIDHHGTTHGVRLNMGGYQAGHTWLKWTNSRYVCFGIGCGSPCWGVQLLDLQDHAAPTERLFTVYEDSVLNLLCYADTAYTDDGEPVFIAEDLVTGRKHRFTVPMERVAVAAAAVDSAWRIGSRICMRCAALPGTRCTELPWLQE